jgi:peptide-methionine (S)-S-oxide reductase
MDCESLLKLIVMRKSLFFMCSFLGLFSCAQAPPKENNNGFKFSNMTEDELSSAPGTTELATFGAGCFWCVEAIFQNLKGVIKVQSGYSGGSVKNPSYKEVCMGTTGHAEVCQITYDPSVITYSQLLEVFFSTHDPTTLNRQGADSGTQYRSSIFYHNEKQKELAELAIKAGNESHNWSDPIVTEVVAFSEFYSAEGYHQDYFALNGEQPYCQIVIVPKVDKFKKKFQELLKK